MLNLDELVCAMLDYIDVAGLPSSFSADEIAAGLVMPTERQTIRCLSDINGALQEMFEGGPPHLSRRPFAVDVQAPAVVAIDVTEGSTAVTITGYLDWMAGCLVRITGATYDNELVIDINGEPALLQPFRGTDGQELPATVYCDAIALDSTLIEVLGDPEIPNVRKLCMAAGRESFLRADIDYWRDYGRADTTVQRVARSIGQPHTAWIESVLLEDEMAEMNAKRLRLCPLPDTTYTVRGDALYAPPAFTLSDLNNSLIIQLPNGWHESILLPMALQRFTASPWWKNADVKTEIARQYTAALKILQGTRPQNKRPGPMRPGM